MQQGAEMARLIQPGSVISLVGDLGAGKTHWVKGFVAALGSAAQVTSPTFTLLHEYRDGKMPIFHLDFYRLESEAEVWNLGWDELFDEEGVILVEWGNRFPNCLPPETWWLNFEILENQTREITAHQGGYPN